VGKTLNNNLYQEAVKEATKKRYGNSQQLKSKYIALNPDTCEREMVRLSNSYMRIINAELKDALPEIIDLYSRQIRNDSRMDSLEDLVTLIKRKFSVLTGNVSKKTAEAGIIPKIKEVAKRVKRISIREWQKAIQRTLGIEIAEDYYQDDMYQTTMDEWTDEHAKSMPETVTNLTDKIQEIIQEGYRAGKSVTDIQKEVQEAYRQAKGGNANKWSESIPYLNSQLNKITQEDAGVKQYVWTTRRDARVRPCHRALDGRTIWWDDPPVQWYETKSRGRVYTGQRAHPGESYGCRCYAVPVFDKDHFAPPVKATKEGESFVSGIQAKLEARRNRKKGNR